MKFMPTMHIVPSIVLGILATAVLPWTQWAPHMGQPPPGIVPASPTYAKLKYPDSCRALVWFEMAQRKITFQWRREGPDVSRYQTVATSYWPTAVTALQNGNELLVAGKRRNGFTVIELWTIAKPTVYSPAVGASELTDAVVTQIESIYDDAVQGRDMVLRMVPKPNVQNAVLVQFFDSRSLYEVKWTAAATTTALVASPATLPALQTDFTFAWSKDHKTRGYIYVFRDEDVANSTMVLIDQDRNGSIDSAIAVTDSEWVSGDWGVASSYQ